jgi:hypothetical protein
MNQVSQMLFKCSAILIGCLVLSEGAMAQVGEVNKGADNLMAVLRESEGLNKQDETLQPMSRARMILPDGKQVDFELAAFAFLGDMHIRFVFDAPTYMLNAKPEDLKRLNLTPNDALDLAVANIERVYGSPRPKYFGPGLMEVVGKSPDLDSSYFLDRNFWRSLLKQHPEGLVVAVPRRGALLFTPLNNTGAVEYLKTHIAHLHAISERMRVSSALYLFKDDHWAVFQAAERAPTASPPGTASGAGQKSRGSCPARRGGR